MFVKLWNFLLEQTACDLSVEELNQVCYIQACSSAYGVELASLSTDLQRQLDQVSFATDSSSFEDRVSNRLLHIGVPHQRDFSPLESFPRLLSIDIACPDRMIAIECDGPSHYLSNLHSVEEKRENGPTKAKRRIFATAWLACYQFEVDGRA